MGKSSDIHRDILSKIIEKIKNPSDHIRCSAVCSSWRNVALHIRYTLPHSIPGLILSSKHSLNRTFLNFRHESPPRNYYYHDHDNDIDVSCYDTCCGSHQGWLLLLTSRKDDHSCICLHNPFLKRRRFLPTLLCGEKIYKGVLSSSPSLDTKCVVLILFESQGAAFCCVGDDSWKNISCRKRYSYENVSFSDALWFEGRFYAVDDYGKIYTLDFDNMIMEKIESQPSEISENVRYKWYLVEVQGKLCRVQRKFTYDEGFYYKCWDTDDDEYDTQAGYNRISTREFRVSRMDPGENEWVKVSNLGEYALFLGCNNSVSVSEMEVSGMIKGNKVYFTDDRQKNSKHFGMDYPGRDMGVFDLKDLSIKPVFSDPWYELRDDQPAVWVMPLPW